MSRTQIIIGGTWAVITAFGLIWGLVWLLLPVDDSPWGTAAFAMLSLVSLSLGSARVVMVYRHRDGRIPTAHRWRKPIIAVWMVAFLGVAVPSYFTDTLNLINGVYLAVLLLGYPAGYSALGGADPDRPGWIKLEGITATEHEKR